ncbi:MAG: BREX system Lon protease-like protein BrxL [Syntrophobacteraceae bacterium]|nr:BREX system Lon protease-like protein BrxL [Syntrophobacteraceae bacterium]
MVDTVKLRAAFPDTTVFKDPNIVAIFKAASIPSFLRDWILKRKAESDGRIHDAEALRKSIYEIIPRRENLLELKDAARSEGCSKKFLSKIEIQFSVRSNEYTFAIPELGLGHTETLIEDYVWERIKEEVVKTAGGWGLVQLGYRSPDGGNPRGCFTLLEYKNFCPYTIDLDAYREARSRFNAEEWIDVVLGAIDYNPAGYEDWVKKHTVLARLLPFIEPRLNLIELAPKGTGKSYMFGRVGKYGWLVSGGTLTRAKMFGDINGKSPGLIASNDFVALDEIQSINFHDSSERQGGLKAYMESGEITVGKNRIIGGAGVILLGNIPQTEMDETKDMFQRLPKVFHESALLDRFHGFIRGRDIPRMSENLKINGWALNTEYFSEIMHLLRQSAETLIYRHVVERLVDYPAGADTRDTEAVLRLCTAYLKLLFPHVTEPDSIDRGEFKRYCLRPAVQMRTVIRQQLQNIDPLEYGGKNVAAYTLREVEQ